MVQPLSVQLPLGHGRGYQTPLDIFQEFYERKKPQTQRQLFKKYGGKRFLTTDSIAYATYTALTVTNLQSLAIDTTDPYAGWQSVRISNVGNLYADYEIVVDLSTAATAPANDSAVYMYVVPWMTTDGGTTWISGGNFGTTVLPTGAEGTASISDPNSMKGPVAIPYKITSQRLEVYFTISQLCGGVVPDGWSLAFRNNCGAALSTGCVVAYRGVQFTNS